VLEPALFLVALIWIAFASVGIIYQALVLSVFFSFPCQMMKSFSFHTYKAGQKDSSPAEEREFQCEVQEEKFLFA
jgi:hypothetical protein